MERESGCLLATAWPPQIKGVDGVAEASLRSVDLLACPLCEGQAHIPGYDERGYRVLRPCRGSLMQRRVDLFNRARLPARYVDASLRSFEICAPQHATVLDGLRRYLAGFKPGQPGRVFAGGVGTGKTHLVVSMLRYLTLEKGIPCRYVEFSHLLSDLRALYSAGRWEAELLGPLSAIPVLAVDELGKGSRSDFELRVIDELISRRYNDTSRTTLFATNYLTRTQQGVSLKGDTLTDRIGERAVSRIHEMARFVVLDGGDYRLRGGA